MSRMVCYVLLAISLQSARPAWTQSQVSERDEGAHASVGSLEFDRILHQPGKRWSIREVARRGVEKSPLVAVAHDEVLSAKASTQLARAAALPSIVLSARYTRLSLIVNEPLVPFQFDVEGAQTLASQVTDPAAQELWDAQIDLQEQLTGFRIEVPRNQYALRATVAYPISRLLLEILPAIQGAGEGQRAREYEASAVCNDVALALVRLLMDHARARGALAVAELAVLQSEQNARRAQRLLEQGLGNRPDLLRFRARSAQARRQAARAEAQVISSGSALRTLLTLKGQGPLALEESFTEVPPQRIVGAQRELIVRAWTNRDEAKAAGHVVKLRQQLVRRERGSMAPALGISAGVEYANPNPLFIPPTPQFRTSWSASAQLSWSPDHTWAASRHRNRAEAELAKAEDRLWELRNRIRIEVVEAYTNYRTAFVAMAAAQEELQAAEAAYEGTKRGYELGVGTATDVIDAEIGANRGRLALVHAAATLHAHEYALRRALGEHLWE